MLYFYGYYFVNKYCNEANLTGPLEMLSCSFVPFFLVNTCIFKSSYLFFVSLFIIVSDVFEGFDSRILEVCIS